MRPARGSHASYASEHCRRNVPGLRAGENSAHTVMLGVLQPYVLLACLR